MADTKKYLDYLGLVHLWSLLKTKFANKVDKEDGKGLSTNDYTTTEKNKLAGIASGAEVNVNADWNATTGDAVILNKPNIRSNGGMVSQIMFGSETTISGNDSNGLTLLSANEDINLNAGGKAYYNRNEIATKNDIPTNVSAFTNDAGYLTSYTETDPTVPAWAKASTKPTYTAAEVGALPDTTVIPDAPGTLNTNNSDAQTVSSSESLSGTIKLHKVAKTGDFYDLSDLPQAYYPETTTVPNVTSVGSASTWNFAMGTGSDEHTLIISGGNGTSPSLGTAKTVATGKLTDSGLSDLFPLYTSGLFNSGGSND